MAPMLDWNDLRYFLAVARDGSTLAAAQALRVSQTTVARRIAALEDALGVRLFEKRQAGYSLTPEGEACSTVPQQVEKRRSTALPTPPRRSRATSSGTVKITTEEVYAITVLAPLLRELHELHPDIVIELDTSQAVRDLGAGEADISLRSTKQDSQLSAGLVGRQLCIDDWALYCSRDYAARHGVPTNREELTKSCVHRRRRRQSVDPLSGLASGARPGAASCHAPCDVGRSAVRRALRVRNCRPALHRRRLGSGPDPVPAANARSRTDPCGCSPTSASATRLASERSSTSSTSGLSRHIRQLEAMRQAAE